MNYITFPWFLSRKRMFLCSSEVTAPRLISYWYNNSSIYLYFRSFFVISFCLMIYFIILSLFAMKANGSKSLHGQESHCDLCVCFRVWHIMSISWCDHFSFWSIWRCAMRQCWQHCDLMWYSSFTPIRDALPSFIDGYSLRISRSLMRRSIQYALSRANASSCACRHISSFLWFCALAHLSRFVLTMSIVFHVRHSEPGWSLSVLLLCNYVFIMVISFLRTVSRNLTFPRCHIKFL